MKHQSMNTFHLTVKVKKNVKPRRITPYFLRVYALTALSEFLFRGGFYLFRLIYGRFS